MTDWQPIETAPRDGGHVIVYVVLGNDLPTVTLGKWNVTFQRWDIGWSGYVKGEPTHWMPLPPPPKGEGDG